LKKEEGQGKLSQSVNGSLLNWKKRWSFRNNVQERTVCHAISRKTKGKRGRTGSVGRVEKKKKKKKPVFKPCHKIVTNGELRLHVKGYSVCGDLVA